MHQRSSTPESQISSSSTARSNSTTTAPNSDTSTATTPTARRDLPDSDALVAACAGPVSRPTLSRLMLHLFCFPVARKFKSRARSVSAPQAPSVFAGSTADHTRATNSHNNEKNDNDQKTNNNKKDKNDNDSNDAPSGYFTFLTSTFNTGGQPRAFDSRIPYPDDLPLPPTCHPFWIGHSPFPQHRARFLLRRPQRSRRPRTSSNHNGHA